MSRRKQSSLLLPLIALSALTMGLVFLAGCEQEEDRKLWAAQQCLDNATTGAQAEVCANMVSGMTTDASYLIRCSAHYIYNGLTSAKLASAFQNLKDNPSSGNNSTITVMKYMVFSSKSGAHGSTQTLTDCTLSKASSFLRFATITAFATELATGAGVNLSNIDSLTEQDIKNALSNYPNASNSTLGTLALQVNSAYCATGSSFINTDVCKSLSTATSSTDPATVGAAIRTALQSNPS